MHYAAKHEGMNSDYVDGAVLYGDPEDGIAHIPGISADNIKEFCAAGGESTASSVCVRTWY